MAAGYTPVDDDLYREIILDHYRNPRHHQAVDPADRVIEANNPLCGDEIDLSYRLDDGKVAAIGFMGRGCSISQASASMLCEAVTGMSVDGATQLAERFRAMLTGGGDGADSDDIGDLEALRGVRAYPVRVKCATLVWNALLEGLAETAPAPTA
jgi:nitrogen fixation NifU-like protein